MFFRKLLGSSEPKQDVKLSVPNGVALMGATLQKKFAKGVQYNSKCNLTFFCLLAFSTWLFK